MKMNKFFPLLIASAIVFGGCSSTFLVSKDGKGYFWGNDSRAIYKMLCESGDLKKILDATRFTQILKEDIYKYNCSMERSGEKVKQIYASLTSDQRRDLRNAFKGNGYDINYLPC